MQSDYTADNYEYSADQATPDEPEEETCEVCGGPICRHGKCNNLGCLDFESCPCTDGEARNAA
jgi:hypothetical protein